MFHHVRVLAGPPVLDEVGSEGFHDIFRLFKNFVELLPAPSEAAPSPFLPFSLLSYLQSSISKTFQRCIIDTLEQPEMVSTMLLPGREQHTQRAP